MIKGRQPGSNITIMNTLFWRAIDDSGKMRDCLSIIYKDCDTGKTDETLCGSYKCSN